MANIIEIANSAYEERDRAQEKLAMLRQQAEKEKKDFDVEMKQVTDLIEKDRNMRDLMKGKEQEKSDLERMTLNKSEGFGSGEMSATKIKPNRMSMTQNSAQKNMASTQIEKIESYEEAFAKIEAATGIHDIEVLVTNFIKAEEQNFQLFKFVNELSNEIETLEQEIEEMEKEIDHSKGIDNTGDNQRRREMRELNEKLSKTQMKAEQLGLEYG